MEMFANGDFVVAVCGCTGWVIDPDYTEDSVLVEIREACESMAPAAVGSTEQFDKDEIARVVRSPARQREFAALQKWREFVKEAMERG